MDNLNQDYVSRANVLSAEVFLKNWQQTGVRILRAQERMLQGVASVARLEMQFGQELMQNRLAMLKWGSADNEQQRAAGPTQEIEKFTTLMREVADELRTGFSEASQILREGASEQIRETLDRSSEAMKANIGKTAEIMDKTSTAGAQMVDKSVAQGQDAASKTSEVIQNNVDAGAEISKAALGRATKAAPGNIGDVPPKK